MNKNGKNVASEDDRRRQRLAEQLRRNLQRRKEQARARRAGSADERPDGLDAGHPTGPDGITTGD